MTLRLSDSFHIECHDWQQARPWAEPIRIAVFVEEQGVPATREIDGADPACLHALAFDRDGHAIGTARLMPDGRIGRMAVRAANRGQGVGSAMLQALVDQATARGMQRVYLHAQSRASAFYARHGFVTTGAEFTEAGISHRAMTLELADAPARDSG